MDVMEQSVSDANGCQLRRVGLFVFRELMPILMPAAQRRRIGLFVFRAHMPILMPADDCLRSVWV